MTALRRSQWFPSLLSALPLLLATAGPSRADLPQIKDRGTLRVLAVVLDEEPEFFSTKPGQAPGFDHEILGGFANLHRLKLEVVTIKGWDALIPALLKNEGDLIGSRFTVTEARKKQVVFTGEVFPTRHVVMTRKPAPRVETLDQLRAQKIGVVKGTSMLESLTAAGIPAGSIDTSIASGTLREVMRSGRINCTVDDVAGAILSARREPELQLGMFLGPPGHYAYAVRPEDKELLAALNEYVENLRRTQSWNRLVVKYFGEAAVEVLKKARGQ
ncbi:MAG TPA: transporter substrate-binding domain-containing protein [Vicinamibacteria bacterium]|nr:transporter substrate-binding domain-containing protein [Vicinamibacteria bacterium]